MNLCEKGDFVSQYTRYWCIGASMQTMLNITGVTDDEKRASQERCMRVARSMGRSRQVDHGQSAERAGGSGRAGSGGGLVELGAGRYEERALDGYGTAVRAAAYAITHEHSSGVSSIRGAGQKPNSWISLG